MTKIINWLTRTIIQTMLVAGLTVYLTWVTVHTYVDKLLTKYHLDTVESKVNFSDFLTQMSASLRPSRLDNQATEEPIKQVQDPVTTDDIARQTLEDPEITEIPAMAAVEETASPKPTPVPSNPISNETEAQTETIPDDSVSVFNQSGSEDKQEATKQEAAKSEKKKELVISAEDFTKKKDLITDADKITIFTLLATRLPQNEFQTISTYVEDGVTEQEWVDIQKLVEQYLEPAEYNELEDLLAKY